jgi:hypothetical protein
LNPIPSGATNGRACAVMAQGDFQMNSTRPDNVDPIPLRPARTQVGTIMLQFLGLLAVAIAVLAFVYSR